MNATAIDLDGLGAFTFSHPEGTFAISPASVALLRAIAESAHLLSGTGIDWGSGVGCQAVAAAKIDAVRKVYGLELSEKDVETSKKNAAANGVGEKTAFFRSDSYVPFDPAERKALDGEAGAVDFIVSNPPSSEGDDGLGFRRRVIVEGMRFLKPGGLLFLNISFQYGAGRIERLCENCGAYEHLGTVYSSEAVPFDFGRRSLLEVVRDVYLGEERKSGLAYEFLFPEDGCYHTAAEAWARWERTGQSPLTKWQTHLFRYNGA